mgnify:CR=1 FL=1
MKRTSSDNSHWRLQFAIETLFWVLLLFKKAEQQGRQQTVSECSNVSTKTSPSKQQQKQAQNLLVTFGDKQPREGERNPLTKL